MQLSWAFLTIIEILERSILCLRYETSNTVKFGIILKLVMSSIIVIKEKHDGMNVIGTLMNISQKLEVKKCNCEIQC